MIYLLSCKKYSKQYTRETVDNFRLWFNNCKRNDGKFQRGERCVQENLFWHFYSEGHECFLKDVPITLIDHTDASDPKKTENYWMRNLETLELDGLNIEDSVWTIIIFHTLICHTRLDCIRTTNFWNTIFDTYLYLFWVGRIRILSKRVGQRL